MYQSFMPTQREPDFNLELQELIDSGAVRETLQMYSSRCLVILFPIVILTLSGNFKSSQNDLRLFMPESYHSAF